MGSRNRKTRAALGAVEPGGYELFLDDVVESGTKAACVERDWTLGATLQWVRANDDRQAAYEKALQTRAEIALHEGREIVDGATPETVRLAKLRADWRRDEAKLFHGERFGDRVQVGGGGVGGGLTIVLATLPAQDAARIISPERVAALAIPADEPVPALPSRAGPL